MTNERGASHWEASLAASQKLIEAKEALHEFDRPHGLAGSARHVTANDGRAERRGRSHHSRCYALELPTEHGGWAAGCFHNAAGVSWFLARRGIWVWWPGPASQSRYDLGEFCRTEPELNVNDSRAIGWPGPAPLRATTGCVGSPGRTEPGMTLSPRERPRELFHRAA
jgi:hypothetical protein